MWPCTTGPLTIDAVGKLAKPCDEEEGDSLAGDVTLKVRRCKLDPNLKAPGFKGST